MNNIEKIASSFSNVIHGQPWYSNSVSEVFTSLTLENINFKMEGAHSIPEIIEHMIAWRKFAIEQINGNTDYKIKLDSARDWKVLEIVDQELFDALLLTYYLSQKTLIDLIQSQTDEWLLGISPNQKYSFGFLLEGVVQHDIYHLGQIAMLKSASDK